MIVQITALDKLPDTCTDCPIGCRAPAKKSSYEIVIKEAYTKKRHPDCPLREIDDSLINGR